MPLVISLHGFTKDSGHQDGYFGLGVLAQNRGFLYASPDGLKNRFGLGYWNATDACCDFDHASPDDFGYLSSVIDDMSARYDVDPDRIYVVGHSNGAFMSHRMACDASDRIAAIVAVSGASFANPDRCRPSEPVAILDIHGDHDETIAYDGGELQDVRFPGELETVMGWGLRNGCTGPLAAAGGSRDLDTSIAGAETAMQAFSGCAGAPVELWTISGGKHSPALGVDFATEVYDFLAAHPKPHT